MNNRSDDGHSVVVAGLEHITGPSRGTVTWLSGSDLDVLLSPNRVFHIANSRPGETQEDLVARLHRTGNAYEIETLDHKPVWVNGERVTTRQLKHDDMIEFIDTGPLTHYRLYQESTPARKTVSDILGNSADYLRVSRQPMATRTYRALSTLIRQFTLETTILFRAAVLIAILSFAALAYQQHLLNTRLEQIIESGVARLDGVAAALKRTREEALHPSDLAAVREEIGQRLSLTTERLEKLEQHSQASRRVIAMSRPSIAFLQGAYGFREQSSERMLRQVVGDDGLPEISPRGRPLLSLEGDGPVVELQFTGTGFFVGESGALVTNRHVALPWEDNASAMALAAENIVPEMTKFILYLPGKPDVVPVKLLLASESVDLAILVREDGFQGTPSLKLAETKSAAGDEVIVMGYPTGLRAMLVQSGEEFLVELQKTEKIGFWSVATRLAEKGLIAPLSSRGIIGQATPDIIVYDAETTHGGSGGPVLNVRSEVVAVNSAILTDYGGSNLGIPAAKVLTLLKEAGLQ